jgi:hypothetical protein
MFVEGYCVLTKQLHKLKSYKPKQMLDKVDNFQNAGSTSKEPIEVAAVNLNGIVVNEILPAPTTNTGDEFVELYNPTGMDIDISGWTLQDEGLGTWYTAPPGTTIPSGDYLNIPNPGNNGILNQTGDAIYLVDDNGDYVITTYNGYTPDPSDPSLTLGGTQIGSENFGNDIDGFSIQREPDGSMTYTNNEMPTPGTSNICFLAGTRILTPRGAQSIETLKVGDIVNTASGKKLPVKWVGIQSVDINSNRNLIKSNPVVIKTDALGEGIPSSDLRVSPNHAIYVEGLLINGGALVNGVNIYQEVPTEDFKYYHIELDSHELVIAENTWAESYLPQNENRDDFDNAAEFDQQYPDGRKLILWPLDYPRISSQNKVPDYIQEMILRKEQSRRTA